MRWFGLPVSFRVIETEVLTLVECSLRSWWCRKAWTDILPPSFYDLLIVPFVRF
jgi:hypothetical protein